MSSILDDQLRFMALKQYGLIKSIKTPDISNADLLLILKNTENETIKQLAAEKLLKETNIYDLYKVDYELILKSTENETIKQLATEKIQYLNAHPRLGWAGSMARAQRINGLKYRYKVLMKKLKFGIFYIMLINLMGHSKWSWIHLFPCRTQQLSFLTPKVVGGKLPARIGSCRAIKSQTEVWLFFDILKTFWFCIKTCVN